MPTLEFYGMDGEEQQQVERDVRGRLSREEFREDCVFVRTAASHVVDWRGRSRPFIRISTRSAQRAERFRQLLCDACDLEIVRIEFYPQSNRTKRWRRWTATSKPG